MTVLLDDRRLLFRKQDDSTPHVAHVQRLKVEVEHQHIRVDDRHVQILRAGRYDCVHMASQQNTNGANGSTGTWTLKSGLARMLKGGVIMDVVTAEQARIAEDAGAGEDMALEGVTAAIRAQGRVARVRDRE